MPIFKPKEKPVLRWSRLVHLLLAATVTAYGGHLWGYQGSIWAGIASILGGLCWEISNRVTGKGKHPFADALDFWAFVIGATLASVGWILVN